MRSIVHLLGSLMILCSVTMLPSATSANVYFPEDSPMLWIPDQIPALPRSTVAVPVNYIAGGNTISSLLFSVDYDESWLALDPTDSDGDGIPDSIVFNVPPAFAVSVTFDPNDTDGELDIFIADVFPPLAGLPPGTIVSITLETGNPALSQEAPVGFSNDPPPSFGSSTGQSIPGTTDDGSVLIQGCCDLNDDGVVNVSDIQLVALCWTQPIGGSCVARYDIDRDGGIDIVDIQLVAARIAPP